MTVGIDGVISRIIRRFFIKKAESNVDSNMQKIRELYERLPDEPCGEIGEQDWKPIKRTDGLSGESTSSKS